MDPAHPGTMSLEPVVFPRVMSAEVGGAAPARAAVQIIETFGIEVVAAEAELTTSPANQNGAPAPSHAATIVPFASTLRHIA
jgi:hypothetical protein